jgi:asparagine N-glycosylation enzyme membrane subunit Stt3
VNRPGWQTSEFWLQAIPLLGFFLLLGFGRVTVDEVARLWPIFVGFSSGGGVYAIGRSIVKRAEAEE